jgi:nucleosome binding factor SPN SPT16 subunit
MMSAKDWFLKNVGKYHPEATKEERERMWPEFQEALDLSMVSRQTGLSKEEVAATVQRVCSEIADSLSEEDYEKFSNGDESVMDWDEVERRTTQALKETAAKRQQ